MIQRNKFEMAAHDIQFKKRDRADHGQLGDSLEVEKTDWLMLTATVGVTLFAVGILSAL